MIRIRKFLKDISAIVLLATIDISAKEGVLRERREHFPIKISDKMSLKSAKNRGFMLGFLEDSSFVKYLPLALTASLILRLFALPRRYFVQRWALILVIAGAISNIFDRMTRGFVVDYLHFDAKFLKKIIFNLGDVYIFLGAVMGALAVAFSRNRKGI